MSAPNNCKGICMNCLKSGVVPKETERGIRYLHCPSCRKNVRLDLPSNADRTGTPASQRDSQTY